VCFILSQNQLINPFGPCSNSPQVMNSYPQLQCICKGDGGGQAQIHAAADNEEKIGRLSPDIKA
jgi:hypothetical protein